AGEPGRGGPRRSGPAAGRDVAAEGGGRRGGRRGGGGPAGRRGGLGRGGGPAGPGRRRRRGPVQRAAVGRARFRGRSAQRHRPPRSANGRAATPAARRTCCTCTGGAGSPRAWSSTGGRGAAVRSRWAIW